MIIYHFFKPRCKKFNIIEAQDEVKNKSGIDNYTIFYTFSPTHQIRIFFLIVAQTKG